MSRREKALNFVSIFLNVKAQAPPKNPSSLVKKMSATKKTLPFSEFLRGLFNFYLSIHLYYVTGTRLMCEIIEQTKMDRAPFKNQTIMKRLERCQEFKQGLQKSSILDGTNTFIIRASSTGKEKVGDGNEVLPGSLQEAVACLHWLAMTIKRTAKAECLIIKKSFRCSSQRDLPVPVSSYDVLSGYRSFNTWVRQPPRGIGTHDKQLVKRKAKNYNKYAHPPTRKPRIDLE